MKPLVSIETLHEFSASEQRLFLDYLDSPYHNRDLRIRKLAAWIMSQAPKGISQEAAHTILFPDEDYQYDRITNFFSYLQRHIEDFLALEHMKQDQRRVRLSALKIAEQRGWRRLFEKLVGKWERLTVSAPSEEQALLQQQQVALLKNQHLIRQGNRTFSGHLAERGKLLFDYNLLSRLSNACQWLTISQVVEGEKSGFMDSELLRLRHLEESDLSHDLVRIYYYILRMMTDVSGETWYQAFRQELHQLAAEQGDRKTLYQYAQNYCIRQANQGETRYLQELFGLYQQMLHNNLLMDNGILSLPDIKNIVSLGARLGEFDWTKDFLNRYATHFPPEHQESILIYNQAYLAEAEGQASLALRLLRNADFEDIFYQLGARIIIVKCYFQQRDLEGLEATIHAFSAWLRRNKQVSAYQRKVHLNLLRFIRKLALLRAKLDIFTPAEQQKKIQLLEKQIHQTKEITNINWVKRELAAIRDSVA